MEESMKKIIGILLAMVLVFVMVAACAADDTPAPTPTPQENAPATQPPQGSGSSDPRDMITEGFYVYSFNAPGHGDFVQFFRFYEEDPIFGAIFYAGFSNNGTTFSGLYRVEQAEIPFRVAEDRDGVVEESFIEGVAPYTIIFYDFEGNEVDRCGFDGDILYNDLTNISAMGSANVMYHKDVEGAASPFANVFAGEMGVRLIEFVVEDDPIGTVTLFHNRTYLDLVHMLVEGEWKIETNSAGGFDYILTPEFDGDPSAVISASADGLTAVYTSEDGSVLNLINTATLGASVEHVFEGLAPIEAFDTEAPLILILFDDGTAELEIELFGHLTILDSGTFVMVNDFTFGITFNAAGYVESEIDFETFIITVDYDGEMDQVGPVVATLTLLADGHGTAGGDELFSFTAEGDSTLTIYADGTYRFALEAWGVEEFGIWEFEGFDFSLIQEDGNIINAEIGADHSLNLRYIAVVSDQLQESFTAEPEVWGGALVG